MTRKLNFELKSKNLRWSKNKNMNYLFKSRDTYQEKKEIVACVIITVKLQENLMRLQLSV